MLQLLLRTWHKLNPNAEIKSDGVKDYMCHVRLGMRWMAMLPIFDNPKNIRESFINYFYYVFADLSSTYISVFSFMDLITSKGDLFEATYNLVNTVIYSCNTIYLLYFQIFQADCVKLLDSLNNTFKFRSAEGLTRLDMRESIYKVRLYSLGFLSACVGGALHWAVIPLFHKGPNRILPLKIWYPINIQHSPIYEAAYLSQVYGQILVGVAYANFGNFYLSICVLICGQFDILCCSLRNLRYTALLKRNYPITKVIELSGYDYKGSNKCTLPEDEVNIYFSGEAMIMEPKMKYYFENGDLTDPAMDDDLVIANKDDIINDDLHEEVNACIKESAIHHQKILEFCSDMEDFFNPLSFVKLGQITLLACFLMYAFSVSYKMTLFEYFALSNIDLFLLCYFGNEVSIRSGLVGLAACGGLWPLYGKRCINSLMPIIIRAGRPICFTGGKFYPLTLENFIAVAKLSFSYFTVLRTVNEKEKE